LKRLILSLVILMTFSLAPVALAQTTSQVRVQPDPFRVALGKTAQLTIEIVDVKELYGVDFLLKFDPAALEVVDAEPNQAGIQVNLGTFLDAGVELRNQADNAAGTVRFAMTQLHPSPAKSGSGSLVVITFRGKALAANSPLRLENVQLARRDGIEIQANTQNGVAQVLASIEGPTHTPQPTQAGGTPIKNLIETAQAMPTNTAAPTQSPTATGLVNPTTKPTATPTATQPPPTPTVPALSASSTLGALQEDTSQPAAPPSLALSNEEQPGMTEVAPVSPVVAAAATETNQAEGVPAAANRVEKENAPVSPFVFGGVALLGGAAGFGLAYWMGKRKPGAS